MPTEKQIRDGLEEVLVPGAMRSLSKLNLVRDITISNERVSITLGSAALNQGAQDWLKAKVSDTSKGQEMAKAAGAPLLGQFPIDPELAKLCDEGEIERYDSEALDSFAEAFLQAMPAKAK